MTSKTMHHIRQTFQVIGTAIGAAAEFQRLSQRRSMEEPGVELIAGIGRLG
ncbi:hypothetical protein [Xaviernesmea oryzae]|uniref:hypothetical protein n=1 Tax=Xaviernesmea oryzae TaxID=464029 RepID=UPI0008B59D64|nr:hypothetical protein [Xaviernesmea oryzae]SEL74332.1 hypothetical protein SAMN04487976_11225 [Xaviernesmea oryzae]